MKEIVPNTKGNRSKSHNNNNPSTPLQNNQQFLSYNHPTNFTKSSHCDIRALDALAPCVLPGTILIDDLDHEIRWCNNKSGADLNDDLVKEINRLLD